MGSFNRVIAFELLAHSSIGNRLALGSSCCLGAYGFMFHRHIGYCKGKIYTKYNDIFKNILKIY